MNTELAQNLMLLGRYAEALEIVRPAVAVAVAVRRSEDEEARWSILVSRLCRFLGWHEEGLSNAVRALRCARRVGDPLLLAQSHHAIGIALKAGGRFDRAAAYLANAERILPKSAPDEARAGLLLDLSELWVESGELGRLSSTLVRGAALAHHAQSPKLLAWSLLVHSETERPRSADLELTAALEICRALRCPELEWQVLWKLGVRAGENRMVRLREELFAQALSILARLSSQLSKDDAARFWLVRARKSFLLDAHGHFGPNFLERLISLSPDSMVETKTWGMYRAWIPQMLPRFARASILR